ncbi:hypothetical protein [Alkaliphilus peptidifermentans]|uniref:Uncharacterized protein n=1 Tax=Alkaliphilus peptidifermentans DSM 18978 TaxID=1120976 RepID=A0A1G5IDS0_9FIRM|nr:hypothetical protein [Alkaliphilus peptidifermentans]SCY73911.1 hypothetical protein SAMN03080606_02349 [Alkaliphilus peptidifermentans DSM 18978]
MAKRRNNRKRHVSFTERLGTENVMPDGMLESVTPTTMAILSMAKDAPEPPEKNN